jgi:hypothetical protein
MLACRVLPAQAQSAVPVHASALPSLSLSRSHVLLPAPGGLAPRGSAAIVDCCHGHHGHMTSLGGHQFARGGREPILSAASRR